MDANLESNKNQNKKLPSSYTVLTQLKNYHQKVRNSLRSIVDEQFKTQITEIHEKCSTFERNLEKIIDEKRKDKELKTNCDLSYLIDLQQRHYKELKQSIERINNNKKGTAIHIEIAGNELKNGTIATPINILNTMDRSTDIPLAISDPKMAISNPTTISIPYPVTQPVTEKVIPDKTATSINKDFPLTVENEETVISTSTLLTTADPDIQPLLQETILDQHVTDESNNGTIVVVDHQMASADSSLIQCSDSQSFIHISRANLHSISILIAVFIIIFIGEP